ncbi:OmpA family protein [Hymenobacter guriensis]|uniref:OmpA family protein n=1 Tax=Hymenobacter guriensis TaxID=2793065 RepID=A0ABS0KYD2_9BACT|nr:OmpA family protein [Hymenobacter guriensis]MBG8552816.1 OmpA family protein [Hymenobacter guriensis]
MFSRLFLLLACGWFAHLAPAQTLVPRLILEEDFQDNHRNWPTGLINNAEYKVRRGEYVAKARGNENNTSVALLFIPELEKSQNFIIEAELSTTSAGCLAWGSGSRDNMRLFGTMSEHRFAVCGWRGGKFFSTNGDNAYSAAVGRQTSWHTMRIECRGPQVQYFVNGTRVWEQQLTRMLGHGLGLETNLGAEASLRHLRVWLLEPEPEPVAAPVTPEPKPTPVASSEATDAAAALATPLRAGQRLALRNVFFVQGKPELLGTSKPELARLAKALNDQPALRIRLEGHTDNQGPEEKNQLLSEQRAQAIQAFLVKYGVAATRLETTGYGSSRPVAANDTETNRRRNRRVEFVILD